MWRRKMKARKIFAPGPYHIQLPVLSLHVYVPVIGCGEDLNIYHLKVTQFYPSAWTPIYT